MESNANPTQHGIKPVFDTTIDVVTFALKYPMDYVVERQHVKYTSNGLQYESQIKEESSSASSDEEFVSKKPLN